MTRAITLAELADEQVLSVDSTNSRIGIGSTAPTAKLDVNGTIKGKQGTFTGVVIQCLGCINTLCLHTNLRMSLAQWCSSKGATRK